MLATVGEGFGVLVFWYASVIASELQVLVLVLVRTTSTTFVRSQKAL